MRRVHTELLIQAASDLTLENVVGQIDEAQNSDNIRQIYGPVEIELAASATDIALAFPSGATYLRFLAIVGVDALPGVSVKLAGIATTGFLVKPPTGTDMSGEFYVTTSIPVATGVQFTNPSSSASVTFRVMAGFAIS